MKKWTTRQQVPISFAAVPALMSGMSGVPYGRLQRDAQDADGSCHGCRQPDPPTAAVMRTLATEGRQ